MECLNGGFYSVRKKRCFCSYQWTGKNCSRWRHHRCYFNDGFKYRGFLSETKSGKLCAPWTIDSNGLYPLNENGIGVHNFCRNPGKDHLGLWCYVAGEEFFEYCNATRCPDSYKINYTDFHIDYNGEDSTVAFLYGPLITGICAGMISLILVFVLVDCIRKKRFCFKSKKLKTPRKLEKLSIEEEEEVKEESVQNEKKEDESSLHKEEEEDVEEVKTLGGIITVNIDTGEQKIQTLNKERGLKDEMDNLSYRKTTSLYDAHSVTSEKRIHTGRNFKSSSGGNYSGNRAETASLPPTRSAYADRKKTKYTKSHHLPVTNL